MTSIDKSKPLVLTIAASDSAGMAGVAMDIKIQRAFNVHSLTAITANTAQNNERLVSINPVDAMVLKDQLEAIKSFPISVVKVGLIANVAQAKLIAHFVEAHQVPLVLDPVLSSTSGFDFFDREDLESYVEILLPLCDLITPNIMEALLLTKMTVSTREEVELAAASLKRLGAKNVLIKGGHIDDSQLDLKSDLSAVPTCQDYFSGDQKSFWLLSERQATENRRGTGCALASSIASSLALGYSLADAVVIGKMAINQALKESYSVAEKKGPVSLKSFPYQGADLPLLVDSKDLKFRYERFPSCNQTPLGLYPVVDRAHWLNKLLPLGVTTIQLRVKDLVGEALEKEIVSAIKMARQYDCRLFINDYWTLAIKHNAYGVHLGQEDLGSADIEAIRSAGLRLGLSSHCHYEVARAIRYKPSYIACGPVYHTNSKQMPWIPHGIEGLTYWQNLLDYPVVAIGGINQERLLKVIQTGVDGVAMISAITESSEPEKVTSEFIKHISERS